ncbi:hypothetical protein [Streptomyces griseomycini]|uniref:Toxin-antitoxin system HicB family antitoxin n=1 Tax=Streptomyces griseomycini TaxID=66895 RepID=A0A7W7PXD0_9ACTN|nr:hypothetical protein [Streptomyces griseomycini]MBB4902973.1 hypothetical protein [Streptomyces griseomycini]GGQ36476.1 hypothetical protein GCM10010266_69680 [Streptomyces griseomycini]GGR51087.1 hypothetical protein GCM10015536_65880 [Streptomyces griseomycini]
MDLTPYLDSLRRELATAARAGGEDAEACAGRLLAALEPATRLTLLRLLSDAAGEISRDLAPGTVEVFLHGTEPRFAVTRPDARDLPPAPPRDADPHPVARVSLRLPEPLKTRAEQAAARQGSSLNAWLVRLARTHLERPAPAPALIRSTAQGEP